MTHKNTPKNTQANNDEPASTGWWQDVQDELDELEALDAEAQLEALDAEAQLEALDAEAQLTWHLDELEAQLEDLSLDEVLELARQLWQLDEDAEVLHAKALVLATLDELEGELQDELQQLDLELDLAFTAGDKTPQRQADRAHAQRQLATLQKERKYLRGPDALELLLLQASFAWKKHKDEQQAAELAQNAMQNVAKMDAMLALRQWLGQHVMPKELVPYVKLDNLPPDFTLDYFDHTWHPEHKPTFTRGRQLVLQLPDAAPIFFRVYAHREYGQKGHLTADNLQQTPLEQSQWRADEQAWWWQVPTSARWDEDWLAYGNEVEFKRYELQLAMGKALEVGHLQPPKPAPVEVEPDDAEARPPTTLERIAVALEDIASALAAGSASW